MTRDRHEDAVPGPQGSWLAGSARELLRDQLGAYEAARRDYGDFVRFRLGPPRIGFTFDAVFHPDGARQVLASTADSYDKDVPVVAELARVVGDGLVTSGGEQWRFRRRTIQPLFTRERVASYVPIIAREAARLVDRWGPDASAGRSVDLHEAAVRFSLRVLGSAVLGAHVERSTATLAAALPVLNEHVARRGLSPVRSPHWLPTPRNRRAAAAQGKLVDLVERLVRQPPEGDDSDALVSRLLAARDPESGAALEHSAVRDEALTFVVAGHETSASALALTLHLLGQRPDLQDRVREEANRVLDDRPLAAANPSDLAFTGQVVQESLRLYPPVHTVVRHAREPVDVCGYSLPAGRVVAVSAWGIHRHPGVWPDPVTFAPDRFAPGVAGRPRYAHLPFGGGPRACVGVHLAMFELVLATAAVVGAYRLRTPDGPPAVNAGVTLRPAAALPCRLEPLPAGG